MAQPGEGRNLPPRDKEFMLGRRLNRPALTLPDPVRPLPVAVINLDQLRPLYLPTILTTMTLEDSTLGQTVRDIAGPMGIEVRPDRGLIGGRDGWHGFRIRGANRAKP